MRWIKLLILVSIPTMFLSGCFLCSLLGCGDRAACDECPSTEPQYPAQDFVGSWEIKKDCAEHDGEAHGDHIALGDNYSITVNDTGTFHIELEDDNAFRTAMSQCDFVYQLHGGRSGRPESDGSWDCNRFDPEQSDRLYAEDCQLHTDGSREHDITVYMLSDSSVHGRDAPVIKIKPSDGASHQGYLH